MKGSYRGPDRLEVKGTNVIADEYRTAWKLKGRMSLLMSIVLSIPFNSLSIPFVSLLKIFHFSLLVFKHTIVHDCGSRACDDLTQILDGREVEGERLDHIHLLQFAEALGGLCFE